MQRKIEKLRRSRLTARNALVLGLVGDALVTGKPGVLARKVVRLALRGDPVAASPFVRTAQQKATNA